MGLFSRGKDPAPEPAAPSPHAIPALSQDRIKALFDEKGWNYYVDNEGDLGGVWDDNQFWFLLRGQDKEILHIQARWHRPIDISRLEEVREFIVRWHREKLWPKCYHRINDEGVLHVYGEVTHDHEHGVTDDQLMQQIRCAIGTSNQFFDELARELGI